MAARFAGDAASRFFSGLGVRGGVWVFGGAGGGGMACIGVELREKSEMDALYLHMQP